ncbi:unnamed protein product [Caenorhabditis bovis]|uniref:CCDC93 N-terminal domain-containing protein n=1 Tax=Caenorhabditis bovis TaxID=2654633 RepID=A0A8S1F3P5_9PELO|nr:unnamed protein product [Caenorhabditis bovis]
MSKPPSTKIGLECLQIEKREECIEILNAAGYKKVMSSSLDYFDRIVGGMVWCLVRCNISVDLNLLYEENCSIGHRISTTEVIVRALLGLNCPYRIEPHQIQGLDYVSIFPIIQWLVKVSEEMSKKDKLENTAQWYANIVEYYNNQINEDLQAKKKEFMEFLDKQVSEDKTFTKRNMKRTEISRPMNLEIDARTTFAEYVQAVKDVVQKKTSESIKEFKANEATAALEACSSEKVRYAVGRWIKENLDSAKIEEIYQAEMSNDKEGRERYEEVINNINEELRRLTKMIEFDAFQYAQAQVEYISLEKQWSHVHELVKGYSTDDNQKLNDLVKRYNEVKKHSKTVCSELCRDIGQVDEKLRAARLNIDEHGTLGKYEVKTREVVDKLCDEKTERRQLAVNLAVMQRKIDESLTATVETQFHKRVMERAEDNFDVGIPVITLNTQLKTMVMQHNTAVDILHYTTKILSYANRLEEEELPKPLFKKTCEEYRIAFMAYMTDVKAQLSEFHMKAKYTQESLWEEKQKVARKRVDLRDKLREMNTRAEYIEKILKTNDYIHQYQQLLERVLTLVEPAEE